MIKNQHLPQPGEFIAEWEQTHFQAPSFRQEYDALRRAWDSMFAFRRQAMNEKACGKALAYLEQNGYAKEAAELAKVYEAAKADVQWWDEYMPAYVWLQSHGGSKEAFDELGDVICQECMTRFLPRIKAYAILMQAQDVQARMDGKTLYHVKKAIKGILDTKRKNLQKIHS